MPCYRRLPNLDSWGLHARHQKVNPGGGGGGGTGGGAGPGGGGAGRSGGSSGGSGGGGILGNFGLQPLDQEPHPFEPADEGDPGYEGIDDFILRRSRGGAGGGGGGTESQGGWGSLLSFGGASGGSQGAGGGNYPGSGGGGTITTPGPAPAPSTRFAPSGVLGFGNRDKSSLVPEYLRDIFGPDPYALGSRDLLPSRSVSDMPGAAEVRPGAVFGKNFRVPGGFDLPPEVAFKRRLERPRYEFGAATVRRRNFLDEIFDAINGLLGNR